MAWTVNFKACKRCGSGEYWLVSSGFTNTVHPVAAGSRTRAWICTHSSMSRSPWEGGQGFPKSCLPGKTRPADRGDDLRAGGGLSPGLGLPLQHRGSLQRWARSLRFGLRCFASCARLPPSRCCTPPTPRACASPGSRRVGWIVKETHSAMNSPDVSPLWPASTWWLFSSRCCSR